MISEEGDGWVSLDEISGAQRSLLPDEDAAAEEEKESWEGGVLGGGDGCEGVKKEKRLAMDEVAAMVGTWRNNLEVVVLFGWEYGEIQNGGS